MPPECTASCAGSCNQAPVPVACSHIFSPLYLNIGCPTSKICSNIHFRCCACTKAVQPPRYAGSCNLALQWKPKLLDEHKTSSEAPDCPHLCLHCAQIDSSVPRSQLNMYTRLRQGLHSYFYMYAWDGTCTFKPGKELVPVGGKELVPVGGKILVLVVGKVEG